MPSPSDPRILITGADGFIGRNLRLRLEEAGHRSFGMINRETSAEEARAEIEKADFVFHLAGVNRPRDPAEFAAGNADFTARLCDALAATGRRVPIVLSSSTQAMSDNPYGRSKKAAEEIVVRYGAATGAAAYLFRLPNVFGKWSRPNYNSAVATFCHNIARGLPITINDPAAPITLVYIDDVVDAFMALLAGGVPGGFCTIPVVYTTTVGEVADTIQRFAACRESLIVPPVGTGLVRALYATFVSFLPPESFAYSVPRHGDPRGVFVEMLNTPDCGQFSYFTAHPGITRGEHYHHSKTEKFLVIKGTALFAFRHVLTGERHELIVRGEESRIVDTAPGWAHNLTNVGDDELVVMLWANEIFDRSRPDTIAMKVNG
jgi:UDP-2-acetamido-2,6-beta-L-arabino-hexul-4-ose reductase